MGLLNRVFGRSEPADPPPITVRNTQYFAAEIQCGTGACKAALNARGHRYLASEAPPLPLVACDRNHCCTCWFRYSEDRRLGARRR